MCYIVCPSSIDDELICISSKNIVPFDQKAQKIHNFPGGKYDVHDIGELV